MAQFEEASPICRGKNLSWETVLLFYNNMPREAMPKTLFNSYTEARINGWTQTHSQIARQLAFYYEEDGICYPRFTKEMGYAELFKYMQNWAAKYFIPNPYAPSLKGNTPTNIYEYILHAIKSGKNNFDEILDSMFEITLSSHDKVKVYLNNFTNLIIDDNRVSINKKTFGTESILHPDKIYATDQKNYFDYFDIEAEIVSDTPMVNSGGLPLQQIFYGAPGTGKSHEVKKRTGELSVDNEDRDLPNVFRSTFHPDTDYASFVGCYKPSMRKTGKKHQVDGKDIDDEEIIYEFVPQTFTDAYVYAYENPTEPTYLVIEEINRGNCAQIFGDLFQLLDRKNGVSEYRIKADKDLAKFLNEELGKDADGIKDGKLRLPANLNILATMNTSDQSLFPIDSAFKRRWEWVYTPIDQGKDEHGNSMKWQIEGQGEDSWWTFIQGINEVIDVTTHSEDKKLGFFFCKAQDGVIKKETFVNKVVFYLWNDVFKVYGFKSEIFDKKGKGDKTEKITFKSFYKNDGSVNEETMSVFVKNVMAKAPKVETNNDAQNENEETGEESETEA